MTTERLAQIRADIEAGVYLTDDKLEAASERLTEAVIASLPPVLLGPGGSYRRGYWPRVMSSDLLKRARP